MVRIRLNVADKKLLVLPGLWVDTAMFISGSGFDLPSKMEKTKTRI
jgi:hypothetical protein